MNGRLLACSELTASHRADMLALLDLHFVGVSQAQFARDLAEKNWVILLEDSAGRLRGFSTLLFYSTEFDNAPVRVVFSGDTIVDPAAWGSNALARTWLGAVRQWGAHYWLLITSGFRTYRFLPVFWREFWPRLDSPDSPPLLNQLARRRFGDRYDPLTGIVRLTAPQVLRNALKEIPPNRLSDPHVAFFAARNPGYRQGDELACLCPLNPANQSAIGRKLVPL